MILSSGGLLLRAGCSNTVLVTKYEIQGWPTYNFKWINSSYTSMLGHPLSIFIRLYVRFLGML
jgi:hypothetical protein